MEFRILGPLEVVDAGSVVPVVGEKQRALLAILLLHTGEVVSADRLVEQLWEGAPPEGARTTLRSHVARLRRALGLSGGRGADVALVARVPGYVLQLDRDEQLDVTRFERLVVAGRQALAQGDAAAAAAALRRAQQLWRGPPLADFPELAWAQREIARLEELKLAAVEYRVEADLALGCHRELIGELEMLVREHPLRERLWGQLMLALYRSGRQAEALQAYQQLRFHLTDELGLEPGGALRRLEEDILLQRPQLDWVPPRTSSGAASATVTNLPVQLTSFIGRELDIRQVRRLVETRRLVTLTGAGGCGKTRLALEVAARLLDEQPDGSWFIALAPLTDPDLVPETVAVALAVDVEPGRPPVDLLIDHLRSRRLLLVLDNCEHLVAACAELIDRLLRACPHLRVLTTSQEVLGVPGEVAWQVPSLSTPRPGETSSLEELLHYEAVHLFVERARAARPGLALSDDDVPALVQVCSQLDGIPLAIELAAARVPVLTLREIADRLDDRFRLLRGGSRTVLPRHQTLRAAVEWSHDLLGPSERILFRRLSVFAGGCDLEAVEAVCAGDGLDGLEVLDRLARLVAKSIVVRVDQEGTARYRMLETLRAYARERLDEAGETTSVRRRHHDWYLRLAVDAETQAFGVHGERVLVQLAIEHDNFRAALEWGVEDPDGSRTGLRMVLALYPLWWLRGHCHEGRTWMETLSQRADLGAEELSAVTRRAANLGWRVGDLDGAARLADEALTLARRSRVRLQIGKALKSVAEIAMIRGELERAGSLLEESLAIAREVGDDVLVAGSLIWLGWVAQRQGHYDDARARAEEFRACSDDESWYHVTRGLYLCGWLAYEQGAYPAARERLRRVRGLAASAGDREYEALALEALGMVAVAEGRYAEAREYSEEALSQVRTVRQLHMVGPLGALGLLAATQGDHAGAERLLAEGLARARRLGDVYILARMLNRVGMASAALGDAAAARAAFQEALERSWLTGMPWPMAAALEGLAELDARHGDPERAARLLGAAEALRANVGSTQPPFSRDGCERALSQIKAALGEDGCDKALAEGRAMGLDEVVAIAGLCCMEAGLVTG